jgi:hypothetical protein
MKKLISKIDNYLYDFLGEEFYPALIVGIYMAVSGFVVFYGTYYLIIKYIHASRGY